MASRKGGPGRPPLFLDFLPKGATYTEVDRVFLEPSVSGAVYMGLRNRDDGRGGLRRGVHLDRDQAGAFLEVLRANIAAYDRAHKPKASPKSAEDKIRDRAKRELTKIRRDDERARKKGYKFNPFSGEYERG